MYSGIQVFRWRKNIILYGMPDEKDEDPKRRCEIDDTNIRDLLKELKVNAKNYEISRIGKQTIEGRPRPIRVELTKETDKFEILKNAVNLKTTRNETFKRVIVTTDMSFKQRKAEKLLWEELKERKQSGEKNIKIRKGKIVKEEGGGRGQK